MANPREPRSTSFYTKEKGRGFATSSSMQKGIKFLKSRYIVKPDLNRALIQSHVYKSIACVLSTFHLSSLFYTSSYSSFPPFLLPFSFACAQLIAFVCTHIAHAHFDPLSPVFPTLEHTTSQQRIF